MSEEIVVVTPDTTIVNVVTGDVGPAGPAGASLQVLGTLNSEAELPQFGAPGQGWIIAGDLYVWVQETLSWNNVGRFQGPIGPRGAAVLNGVGAPGVETGFDGDFYLDIGLLSGKPKYHLYGPKTNSEWPVVNEQTGEQYVDLFTLPESNYVHTVAQNQASNTWVIEHNLGFFPNVTTVDSAFTQVEGNVIYNSINRLTIEFSTAFAGYAYLS